MNFTFSKTCRGYLHIKEGLPCQDNSLTYKDLEREVVTCCDGHGGKLYFRSKDGSRFASDALLSVFKSITVKDTKKFHDQKYLEKYKLAVLCEWNNLVEQDLAKNPIRKKELVNLSEDELEIIRNNPVKAYGTTLSGALLINNFVVVIAIGDTEAFVIKNNKATAVFEHENDPVGNITYSMCQEDAFKYLKIKVLDFKDVDCIILGTDGLTAPYQSYKNFSDSFLSPLMKKGVFERDFDYIDTFIEDLASHFGVGDDVTLSFISKGKLIKKYYK